jgi:hypothetical protein
MDLGDLAQREKARSKRVMSQLRLGSHSPVYPCGIRHNGQCSHFENPENAPSGYAKYFITDDKDIYSYTSGVAKVLQNPEAVS